MLNWDEKEVFLILEKFDIVKHNIEKSLENY